MAFSLESANPLNTWTSSSEGASALFHYTKIETLDHFLACSVRFSRFTLCNDPTEFAPSRGWRFKSSTDGQYQELKNQLEQARQNGHVFCASTHPLGYAIAPMWAHYATGPNPKNKGNLEPHRGCCVVFDRDKLVSQLEIQFRNDFLHGVVNYRPENQDNEIVIDSESTGNPAELAQEFAEQHLWFNKNNCWEYEHEYRLVVKNQAGPHGILKHNRFDYRYICWLQCRIRRYRKNA